MKPCVAFKRKRNKVSKRDADVYDAVCTENGYFAPLQCNMNSGYCWCADSMGSVVAGTNIYQRPYCGEHRKYRLRLLKLHRRRLKIRNFGNGLKIYLHTCDIFFWNTHPVFCVMMSFRLYFHVSSTIVFCLIQAFNTTSDFS